MWACLFFQGTLLFLVLAGGGGLRATTRKTPVGSPEKQNHCHISSKPGEVQGTIAADIRPVSLYMALGIVHGKKNVCVCV